MIRSLSEPAEYHFEDGYEFGACPRCVELPPDDERRRSRTTVSYVNDYKNIWFICGEHRVKWPGGYGLFSTWELQTEADWARNRELLGTYELVEPAGPCDCVKCVFEAIERARRDNPEWDIPF